MNFIIILLLIITVCVTIALIKVGKYMVKPKESINKTQWFLYVIWCMLVAAKYIILYKFIMQNDIL